MWKMTVIGTIILTIGFNITGYIHTVLSEEEVGTPITVEPLYPENQVKNIKGYYRLKVQPNQKQTVRVRVINNLNEAQKVKVKSANAFTNPVGGMLYSDTIDSNDSILLEDAIKMADNLNVEAEVLLKPKESREIPVEVIVPPIDHGTILGAVRFITEGKTNEESVKTKEGEANFVLKTETVYAIAIQLDLPNTTNPNFSLGTVEFSPEGPNVQVEMINDAQLIQENISGEYQVKGSNGNQLFEGKITPFKMAPKTMIRYSIPWNYKTLEKGDYTLYVKLNINNNEMTTEKRFTIGQNEVNEYVEKTQPIVPEGQTDKGMANIVWFIFGAIALGGFMFWLGKRKN